LATDAQKRAKARYDKTTQQLVMRLRVDADADVIRKLESVGNKTEYIRELIRKDIAHGA
jgi:hypothetical protein